MSSSPIDHQAGSKRSRAVHDPHDIRSLTDTGAISLPGRGAQRTTDRTAPEAARPTPRAAG